MKGCRMLFSAMLLLGWSLSSCVYKESANLISAKKSTKKPALKTNAFDTISTAAQALKVMQDGHTRYLSGRFEHIHIKGLLTGNDEDEPTPYVIILSCSDFKIPAEILFDADKKNLLLFKSDANVENDVLTDTINQAFASNAIKLIIILGHSQCQAIAKIIANRGDKIPASKTAEKVLPAIPSNRRDIIPLTNSTALNNVTLTIKRILSEIPALDTAVKNAKLIVQGAFYDNKTGRITFEKVF